MNPAFFSNQLIRGFVTKISPSPLLLYLIPEVNAYSMLAHISSVGIFKKGVFKVLFFFSIHLIRPSMGTDAYFFFTSLFQMAMEKILR